MKTEKSQLIFDQFVHLIKSKKYEKAKEFALLNSIDQGDKHLLAIKYLALCNELLNNKKEAYRLYQNLNFFKQDDPEVYIKLFNLADNIKDSAIYAYWASLLSNDVPALLEASDKLKLNNNHKESWDCLLKVLEICNDDDYRSITKIQATAIRNCEWDIAENILELINNNIYKKNQWDKITITPLDNLSQHTDQETNLKLARAFCTYGFIKENIKKFNHKSRSKNSKPRIGYVSSDFFNHATMHLMIGVFENHNFDNFDFFAYDHSPKDNSIYTSRLHATKITIKPIHELSDQEAAELIKKDNIDLLIDLKGITGSSRLGIFKRKPAPVQATYLGYPGSVGMEEIDYVITDPIVTPLDYAKYYSEKFCYLPETYQCNDNLRPVSIANLKRSDFGLPEDAVVYCSFNQHHKINRETFESWLTILKNVDNSVLWLLDQNPISKSNLLAYAESCGIAPTRVIFSKGLSPSLHLKRIQLADIALDTFIYNGHTTTADALWSGVPVITKIGTHFASRVASSLLSAIDLPELIANDIDEFIKIAVILGRDRDLLNDIKNKINKNRLTHPLFDTIRFTKHLESAFETMIKDGGKNHVFIEKLTPRESPFLNSINVDKTNFDINLTLKPFEYEKFDPHNFPIDFCPVCRSEKKKPNIFIHKHFGPEKLKRLETHYKICADCGHKYSKTHLSQKIMTNDIFKMDVDLSTFDRDYLIFSSHIHSLVHQPNITKPSLWLDINSSTIFPALIASEYGFTVYAHNENQKINNIYNANNIIVQNRTIFDTDSQSAQVIHIDQYLQEVANPAIALKELRRIIKENGHLFLSFINTDSPSWKYSADSHRQIALNKTENIQLFSLSTLTNLLEQNGFKINEIKKHPNLFAGISLICSTKH